ncbi:MAG: SulP family inorganic anion transporter [Spirosomaceae bacterium]|nr:SulP family inorganic anion transporter [Spirosomataceae bacterium]
MDLKNNLFPIKDLSAGVVVFLVALPLCLGIALASGAPLFAGVIAGICGGIVVGFVSKSNLGVSGPAAGLTIIVLNAIAEIGAYESFLLAVVISGVLQIILGLVGAGKIAFYFPSSVIKGMLSAIGIIIILKQIPHVFGVDKDPEGDDSFLQPDGENTFSELLNIGDYLVEGALIIGIVCLVILIIWDSKAVKNNKFLAAIPGPLLCVIAGISLNELFTGDLQIARSHLVNLPVASSFDEFTGFLSFPDFAAITNPLVWKTAAVIAVIASLESLLCVEATDRLDPERNITPTNRELVAQGFGNIASGMIGGIPVTQVIVRSSANIQAGGKTKASAIFHGFLLLACAAFIPDFLNKIPLSALAAILIMVGYKLTRPAIVKAVYKEGQDQFVPFVVTILAILFTDLLVGILIGLVVGLSYVIYTNFSSSISTKREGNLLLMRFNKDVFFYNRADLMLNLSKLKAGDQLYIDGSMANFIDHDIFLLLEEFVADAPKKGIEITVKGVNRKKIYFTKNDERFSKTLVSK